MSMSLVFDDDGLVDPDDLKVPERAAHRQAVDVIALVATHLLGDDVRIFRDLNWYPADEGPPVAPDVMVLAASAVEPRPRSYRQGPDGPAPLVVVEVPSDRDSFADFRAKNRRYQALGTTVYSVVIDGPQGAVLRFAADDVEPVSWTGQPIPELGRLVIEFDHGRDGDGETLVVVTPDGLRASSDAEFVAEEAANRAEEAADRAEALARQLRALGVEPER